jgi:hypothetical protein
MQNPLSPPVYSGLNPVNGPTDFTYVYDTPATGIPASSALSDAISTMLDADFHWTAIVINSYTNIAFTVRFGINGLYYLSASPVLATNYLGDPSSPYPLMGQLIVPAGARITLDFVDLSGSQNNVEILCRGIKKFR